MGRTEPFHTITAKSPMGSLVSIQNIFSIISQIILSAVIQYSAIHYLENQAWFVPAAPTSPDELIYVSWETTTIFSVSAFQYLILALVFSRGPPFRQPFYFNGEFSLGILIRIIEFLHGICYCDITLIFMTFLLQACSFWLMWFLWVSQLCCPHTRLGFWLHFLN